MTNDKTTASLQTPPGRGGIAVISLLGPAAEDIVREVFRPYRPGLAADAAGRLQLGRLLAGTEVIDEILLGRSRCGVEINIHGGPVVARRALQRLAEVGAVVTSDDNARAAQFDPAHPQWDNPAVGEEMLASLAQAHSGLVVAAVANQWSAGLSKLARETMRDDTIAGPSLKLLSERLREAAGGLQRMVRLLQPAEVVLAGPPNTGKSTLANSLVGRAVSIVHDQAGTTRDWVREPAIIRGVPINLTDTAGLWNAGEKHPIDAESVRRAWERIAQADLILLACCGENTDLGDRLHAKTVLRVATKLDAAVPAKQADLAVSARSGEGMDRLREAILAELGMADFDPAGAMAFTQRQADLLNAAAGLLDKADPAGAKQNLRQLLEGRTNNKGRGV